MNSTFKSNGNKKVISEWLEEPLGEDQAITEEERELILNKFNRTYVEFDKEKTVVDLFEEQVNKTPNNIAIVFENKEMTYKELNERSNSLARVLRKKGVDLDVIVGIMAERSIEMIVGIFAILKAGGAYLPIDPEYPEERTKYILNNSNARMLLIQNKFIENMSFDIDLYDLNDENLFKDNNENLDNIATGNSLAYVIYTSGTTGNPKGVMIEHKSIINRINWMQRKYPINSSDIILQKTPYTFDVSVWEILWWSFVGATVRMLLPDGQKDPELIVKNINEGKVTIIHFVPSMFKVFMDYVIDKNRIKDIMNLKIVFTSGEKLKVEQSNLFTKEIGKLNNTKLVNLYGPTEAAVDVTYYECKENEEIIPIGKPIDNIRIYIVDRNNSIVPIGVAGELLIGGIGLARGYLNNESLTSEKFIDNPYDDGERMYKTGDLARWLPNGNIEYLGRIDDQVKIRGFRIELGEIEHVIRKIDDVNDVVVIARENKSGENEINAYIISENLSIIKNVKEKLKNYFPEYMIPAKIATIDSFPLTPNGKLDKKALPEIKATSQVAYIPPTNPLEEEIVDLWQKILDVDFIGIDDNFLELGGHSLIANKIVYTINKTYEINLSLVEFLTMGLTVRNLSKIVEEKLFDSISEEELSCMLTELDD